MPKKFQRLEGYHRRVDEILQSIQEDRIPVPKSKTFVKVTAVIVVICLVIAGCLKRKEVWK